MKSPNFKPVPLSVSRLSHEAPLPHLATVGVPWAQGAITNIDELCVITSGGLTLQSTVTALAYWPDGSVKWSLVKFLCSQIDNQTSEFLLVKGQKAALVPDNISSYWVKQSENSILVQDGELNYRFALDRSQIFPSITSSNQTIFAKDDINLQLIDHTGNSLAIEKVSTKLTHQDALSTVIEVNATTETKSAGHVNLLYRFEIIKEQLLKITIGIHNPQRAIHPEGLWDLGDPNSFTFKNLSLQIQRQPADQTYLTTEAAGTEFTFNDTNDQTLLFQASSGGKNWNSPTHIDSLGISCNQFPGYKVEESRLPASEGLRANPCLRVQRNEQQVFALKVDKFWQNFPKSLALTPSNISLGLFPKEHSAGHELQPGERKLHNVLFSFSNQNDSLYWADNTATVLAKTNILAESNVLPNPVTEPFHPYDKLIKKSLDSKQGFLAKREAQDEFGWRHYGEVVADHETLYHHNDSIFVSHYNNQYDAIYGFARQYLLTSNPIWYQLMDELAKHVLDIDIYRTTQDRAEYNHGLFWHTDHYLEASTCSHRTYSINHYNEDWRGDKGGGPGPEHCYTSGLTLYYFLVGNPDAYSTVLELTNWIRAYYEGTGSFLERCKRLISVDRYNLISLIKGQPVFRYQYPLNRGVGNYIRALLDSYELTQDMTYINEVESIIINTLGSNDNIEYRNLDDTEHTWFYTIFLQEVIRYLDTKRTIGLLDNSFFYSRAALLHYAHWMVQHETPSLESKKPIEHANDTWIAQDIRKANVLHAAYRYETNTDKREQLLARAKAFRDYVTNSLSESDTLHFARIQIILLQNHGPSALMDIPSDIYTDLIDLPITSTHNPPCFYTLPSFLKDMFKSLWPVITGFSLKREIRWIRARFG